MNPGQSFLPGPTPDTVRAADGKNVFCRVVQGEQSVPAGATYFDALQVQQWMDRLASGLDRGQAG